MFRHCIPLYGLILGLLGSSLLLAQTSCSGVGGGRGSPEEQTLNTAVLARLKHLETVRATEESDRPLKVEFAYLKLLPRDYFGSRHIVPWAKVPTAG